MEESVTVTMNGRQIAGLSVMPIVSVDAVSVAPEKVDHPAHYNQGRFEVIDVIEDWKLGFNDGNAVKYIARAAHKGEEIQDLKKAVWYLNRQIALREKELLNAGQNLRGGS